MAIAHDTLIHTLRGSIPVHKLASLGDRVRCLSWCKDRIGIAELSVDPVPYQVPAHRVVFDNGAAMIVTNTTRFLTRLGDEVGFEVLIQRLQQEDVVSKLGALTHLSVMPIYLSRNNRGYRTYRQMREDYREAPAATDRKRWRTVARLSAEWSRGSHVPAGIYVRHADGDPENCEPENLILEGKGEKAPNQTKLRRLISASRMARPNNHKVVGIQHWGDEEVYAVNVIGSSNFAAGEVFLVAGEHGI